MITNEYGVVTSILKLSYNSAQDANYHHISWVDIAPVSEPKSCSIDKKVEYIRDAVEYSEEQVCFTGFDESGKNFQVKLFDKDFEQQS